MSDETRDELMDRFDITEEMVLDYMRMFEPRTAEPTCPDPEEPK